MKIFARRREPAVPVPLTLQPLKVLTVEVHEDGDDSYSVNVRDCNGLVILSSQGVATISDCLSLVSRMGITRSRRRMARIRWY